MISYWGFQCGRMDQCVAMGPSRIGVMRLDGKSSSLQPLDQVAKVIRWPINSNCDMTDDNLFVLLLASHCIL